MIEISIAVYHVLLELSPWLLTGALAAGVVHVALPKDFVRRMMTGKSGVLRAVLLGVPLPLCSCGVIPAGIGLSRDGASRGASVGFLIATPQTGVDSVLVSGALLGWPFALFKVLSALVMGLVGGSLVDRVAPGTAQAAAAPASAGLAKPSPLVELFSHSIDLIRSIWGWLVVGVLVSALLATALPAAELASWLPSGRVAPLLFALVVSLPIYVCATASVPIAAALVAGGFPLGAALVFLIAGPATNLATMGAVHRTFGGRALAVYLGTLIVGSIGFGLLFDALVLGSPVTAPAHDHVEASWRVLPALLLVGLMGWFAIEAVRDKVADLRGRGRVAQTPSIEVMVEGMTCQGCARRLQSRLAELEGVEAATVSYAEGRAVLQGRVEPDRVQEAVTKAGFRLG